MTTSSIFNLEAISFRRCQSCNHVRGESDQSPTWACPACGIAYPVKNKINDERGNYYATRITKNQSVETIIPERIARTRNTRKSKNSSIVLNARSLMVAAAISVGIIASMAIFSPKTSYNATTEETENRYIKAKETPVLESKESIVKQ